MALGCAGRAVLVLFLYMTTSVLAKKISKLSKKVTVKKEPSVLLPLSLWEELQERLEDLEAVSSANYRRKIDRAKTEIKEGKIVSFEEVVGK
jgi:PHD/YefM family antitoxin component YafN of YafNO toxin-antitoxin module